MARGRETDKDIGEQPGAKRREGITDVIRWQTTLQRPSVTIRAVPRAASTFPNTTTGGTQLVAVGNMAAAMGGGALWLSTRRLGRLLTR